jgi:hypothetical protein
MKGSTLFSFDVCHTKTERVCADVLSYFWLLACVFVALIQSTRAFEIGPRRHEKEMEFDS